PERARLLRVSVLAGRGLPCRAAARAVDGLARGRAAAAVAAIAGLGAGRLRNRRPLGPRRRARLAGRGWRSRGAAHTACLVPITPAQAGGNPGIVPRAKPSRYG